MSRELNSVSHFTHVGHLSVTCAIIDVLRCIRLDEIVRPITVQDTAAVQLIGNIIAVHLFSVSKKRCMASAMHEIPPFKSKAVENNASAPRKWLDDIN
jgi:hypothetical protein